MAAFERLAHHVGVAGAVEAVVRAAVGRIDHGRDDRLALSALIDAEEDLEAVGEEAS